MSDPTPPADPHPADSPPLKSTRRFVDEQNQSLQGIAPAVMDAFLNAGAKKTEPFAGYFEKPPAAEEGPVAPFAPPQFKGFRSAPDSPAILESRARIRAVVEAARASQPEAPTPPPAAPAATADLRQQHLAMRQKPAGAAPPARPATAPLKGPTPPGTGDMRLAHLAMRQRALAAQDPAAAEESAKVLDRAVERAFASSMAIRQSLEALEDSQLGKKLNALTDSVNQLVPGGEGIGKILAEVGKQQVLQTINPVLALSVAAKESAGRLDTLKKWDSLSGKERIVNLTMLSSNVAEILGAVTPPPINFGVQVVGAGLLLAGLATENSESLEEGARSALNAESTRRVATGLNEAGASLAFQVRNAWDELGGRLDTLKKKRPSLPGPLQAVVDSKAWKRAKRHPIGKKLAVGTENVLYNLARRWDATTSQWEHRLASAKERFRR